GDRPGRTAPPMVRLVSQIDGDVGRAAAGQQRAVLVMELRRGERDASCLAHHPAGRADSPGARRLVELRSQVGGEVDLIPVEKAPCRAAHGAAQDGGDHSAVNDPPVAGRKRVIEVRFPLEDGASGLEFRPPPAERIPDAGLAGRRLLPRIHIGEALAWAKVRACRCHPPVRVRSCSTSTRRRIFPDGLFGIWVTTSTCRIFLYGATCWFTNAISSSGVTTPLSTTSAFGTSPASMSRQGITAASATAGWVRS